MQNSSTLPFRISVIGNDDLGRKASLAYKLLAILIATVYASTLAQLPDVQFHDYANYLVHAENSWIRLLSLLSQGILVALSNEPVWMLINAGLSLFLKPESVVAAIVFFSAFVVSLTVIMARPQQLLWLLVFLLLAMVVKNHLIHLRQGLAVAFFIAAWFTNARLLKYFLLALTPLIHASFFFILMILFISNLMLQIRLGPGIRSSVLVLLSLAVGAGVGYVAAFFGARQAKEYEFVMADASGIGFLIWLSVLVIFAFEGRFFLRKHAFVLSFLIFYLVSYWFIEIAARIFESGLLLVLLAGLSLTSWRLFAFKSIVFFVLFAATWLMRATEPALGFGVG